MIDAGIFDGDVLIVNRSIEAKHNDIVLATFNSEFIVKCLYQRAGLIKLISESPTNSQDSRSDVEYFCINT